MSGSRECSQIKAGMFSLPLSINQTFFDRDLASTFITRHEAYLRENEGRPHRFAIHNFLAVFHFRLGNTFKACEYFKETLSEDNSNVNAITDLAYVYQKLYQHTDAEELFAKLNSFAELQESAENSDRELFLKRQSRCIAETGYMYANDLSKGTVSTKKQQQACEMYSDAIRLSDGIIGQEELQDWKFYRSLLYRNMYNIHLDFDACNKVTVKEFYDKAEDDLKGNCKASNTHRQADAYSLLGSLMAKRCSRGMCPRDMDECHMEIKDKGPKKGNRQSKKDKCQCQKEINDFYKTAFHFEPKNIRTYVRYGRELAHSHDFEGALLRLNQAIVLDESSANWFAYSSRAGVYIDKFKQRKDRGYLILAEADLLKSVTGNPSPIDLGRLGHVYHLLGMWAPKSRANAPNSGTDVEDDKRYLLKALHYFMNATETVDGNLRSDIHFKRGKLLLDMKEKRGAVESFKKALECEQPKCKTLKHVESLILSLFDMFKVVEKENRKEILAELCFWWRGRFENKLVEDFVNKKKNVKRMLELLEALLEYQESDPDKFVTTSLKRILNENKHTHEKVKKLLSKKDEGNQPVGDFEDKTSTVSNVANDTIPSFIAATSATDLGDASVDAATTIHDVMSTKRTIAAAVDTDVATITSSTTTTTSTADDDAASMIVGSIADDVFTFGTSAANTTTTTKETLKLKRSESCTLLTIGRMGICMSPVEDHPSNPTEQKWCSIADVVLYICKQLDVQNYNGGSHPTIPHPPFTSKSRFKYDFFVVFSKKQKEWVYYTLLARLEQTYRFKGCIPDRDFLPGKTVCNNIKRSVEESACTLVVIDKEFCEDHELSQRLTYAYYTNARLKRLLIPILKEHPREIPMEVCNITPLDATTTINLSKLARDIEVASLEDRQCEDQ